MLPSYVQARKSTWPIVGILVAASWRVTSSKTGFWINLFHGCSLKNCWMLMLFQVCWVLFFLNILCDIAIETGTIFLFAYILWVSKKCSYIFYTKSLASIKPVSFCRRWLWPCQQSLGHCFPLFSTCFPTLNFSKWATNKKMRCQDAQASLSLLVPLVFLLPRKSRPARKSGGKAQSKRHLL